MRPAPSTARCGRSPTTFKEVPGRRRTSRSLGVSSTAKILPAPHALGWSSPLDSSGLLSWRLCNEDYYGLITESMVRTMKPHADACQGDSAGPLLIFHDANTSSRGLSFISERRSSNRRCPRDIVPVFFCSYGDSLPTAADVDCNCRASPRSSPRGLQRSSADFRTTPGYLLSSAAWA